MVEKKKNSIILFVYDPEGPLTLIYWYVKRSKNIDKYSTLLLQVAVTIFVFPFADLKMERFAASVYFQLSLPSLIYLFWRFES